MIITLSNHQDVVLCKNVNSAETDKELHHYMIYTQSSSMVLGRESCSVSTESLTSSALSLTSGASPRKLSSPAQEGGMSDSSTGARRKTPQASKQKKKGSHNIYILYAYCLKHLYLKQVFVVVLYIVPGDIISKMDIFLILMIISGMNLIASQFILVYSG